MLLYFKNINSFNILKININKNSFQRDKKLLKLIVDRIDFNLITKIMQLDPSFKQIYNVTRILTDLEFKSEKLEKIT